MDARKLARDILKMEIYGRAEVKLAGVVISYGSAGECEKQYTKLEYALINRLIELGVDAPLEVSAR